MTAKTAPAKTRLTFAERLDALTGRDELEIADHFGHDVWDTYDDLISDDHAAPPKKASSRLARMLIFADKRHLAGLPADVAYGAVLDMTVTEVNDYLGQTDEDDESGKDDSAAA